jgi:hypothetical protein
MKKHIIAISIAAALTTSTTFADNKAEGFKNLEDLGAKLDTGFSKVIDGINYIFELPGDTKKWTVSQVKELKNRICEKPVTIFKEVPVEVIKEVVVEKIVEKIIYIDKIVNVPAMPKERQCTTKRQSDRFGNVDEVIACTEWK